MTSTADSPARFYDPGLDILRFCAFLMVFVSHAFPALAWQTSYPSAAAQWRATLIQSGAFGVDVFFALSSFLITTLLIQEYGRTGRLHVGAFYIRRILRIWPLYYAFLIADLYLFPALFSMAPLDPAYRSGFFLFYGNWLCAWHGYSHSCVDILWSVSVEEQFYVLWPLLLWMFGVRRVGLLAILAGATALAAHVVFLNHGAAHPAIWCNTLVRFEPIALGAALAVWRPRMNVSRTRRLGLGVLALAFLITAARVCPLLDGLSSLVAYPLASFAAGLLVCAFSGYGAAPSIGHRALIHLGRISYGLYVFHLFVLSLMKHNLANAGLGLLVTILIAECSYYGLERPFLRLKDRFSYTGGAKRYASLTSTNQAGDSPAVGTSL